MDAGAGEARAEVAAAIRDDQPDPGRVRQQRLDARSVRRDDEGRLQWGQRPGPPSERGLVNRWCGTWKRAIAWPSVADRHVSGVGESVLGLHRAVHAAVELGLETQQLGARRDQHDGP